MEGDSDKISDPDCEFFEHRRLISRKRKK